MDDEFARGLLVDDDSLIRSHRNLLNQVLEILCFEKRQQRFQESLGIFYLRNVAQPRQDHSLGIDYVVVPQVFAFLESAVKITI